MTTDETEKEIETVETDETKRCRDCGFKNPSEALHCGMCGKRIPTVKKAALKKGSFYDKAIIAGEINNAFDFGYDTWSKNFWQLIGIFILAILISAVFVPITLLFGKAFWFPANILFISFMSVAFARIFLDIVRGFPISLTRAIGTGLMRMIPALWPLLWVMVSFLLMLGFFQIWLLAEKFLESFELLKGSSALEIFIFLWRTALIAAVLVPGTIWTLIFGMLAICRTVDMRESVWLAPFWAVKRLWRRLWRFLGIGMIHILAHVFGVIVCYVGILASIPLAGVSTVAVYEWIRLHGPGADEY
ncbi:MAG TPA: hypothetical protein ENN67_06830 [Firmicutes bacterium]|nr:hypothetical protein [Bacillota bacterium]